MTDQHVNLSLSLTSMACALTGLTSTYGEKKKKASPPRVTDRQSEACHTHFASLSSPHRSFIQTGRRFLCLFCLSHHFHRDNLLWSSWTQQPAADAAAATAAPRVFMTCALTHAHAYIHISATRTHTRARVLPQISRGQDLAEATQPISLQIRLITLQRGPANNPQ